LAYVAGGTKGFSVVDVSDPYSPTLVGSYDTLGYTYEVSPSGGHTYVGDSLNGLLILEMQAGGGMSKFDKEPVAGESPETTFISRQSQLPLPVGFTPGAQPTNPAGLGPVVLPVSHLSEEPDIVINPDESSTTSTCVVTTNSDSGAGSLRDCLEKATSATQITFDTLLFPPTNPLTITLLSGLPYLDDGQVTINASNAGVILDGSAAPAGTHGLVITSNANIIQGLQVVSFPGIGIWIEGNNNKIGGNRQVGLGPLGQGNLFSDNATCGISLSFGSNNTVSGNLVGTDLSGTTAWGNDGAGGIFLAGEGCAHNTIGGRQPGESNIVSGNLTNGIAMSAHTHDNLVIGNYVGTDISGSIDIGNRGYGISMEGASYNNRIEGNLSSGNLRFGVCMSDRGSNYNVVVGNRLGTDASGTQAIPNDESGIFIVYEGSSFNRIGGTAPGDGNLISGNTAGISIYGSGSGGILILGNTIGTDPGGDQPVPNRTGVVVGVGADHTFVGGTTAPERNLISGNAGHGIDVCSDYSYVGGNYIGTDASGETALGNGGSGVSVKGAEHSFIQGNRVAYNLSPGFWVYAGVSNTIRRNAIYSHPGRGIWLDEEGNNLLPAPIIASVALTSVSGTTCSGCTVEVFSDAEDEGRVYEGSTVADSTGYWLLNTDHYLSGPHATATATDQNGNTSEFSLFQIVWKWLYLPIIRR
jgi:parallel beta-helix repeat protein